MLIERRAFIAALSTLVMAVGAWAPAVAQEKVQLINMEPNAKPQALLEGRVDCFESFDFLQIPLLEENGMPAASLPISMVGIQVPGLSLITSHEMIKKNPQLVRKNGVAHARRDRSVAGGSECRDRFTSQARADPERQRRDACADAVLRSPRAELGEGQAVGLVVSGNHRVVSGSAPPI